MLVQLKNIFVQNFNEKKTAQFKLNILYILADEWYIFAAVCVCFHLHLLCQGDLLLMHS